MGSKKDRVKKEKWFTRGIEALQRVCPEVSSRLYCCPLCIRGYDSIDALTFEDVPPKSVGGQWVLLTCRECNSRSGHKLDHHVRKATDLREFAEGKRELWATLTAENLKVTAKARKMPEGFLFAGLPEHSNPGHHAAFFSRLERAATSASTDWSFGMSLHVGYDPWVENLSWLRAAYLIAFAALGYTYVLHPALSALREQIRKPEEKIIPYFMTQASECDSEVKRLAIVFEPLDLRSIFVQFGRRIIFLPDLTAGQDFFARLKQLPSGRRQLHFTGRQLDWPTEPVLALDFNS